MQNLQGTKTADNLAKAFAGESQARNRYTFYSKLADKENQELLSSVFLETAQNEAAHAKVFFDFLIQGLGKAEIKVDTSYPIGFGTTSENLQYAAEGEKAEWGTAYPSFADIAKSEGFPEIETAFKNIASIEKNHEKRFLDFKNALDSSKLFTSDSETAWKCRNCGFIVFGKSAPPICPVCKYPTGFYEGNLKL